MATIKEMSGVPSPTPGSAEGTENINEQSQTPPSGHTPGSAEGEDKPELTAENSGEKAA
ncbi:hypothetical protein [Abditibacterium utsteinense]|nr:hypothetical protein [Abditibacterium utsteinense]